MKRPLAYITAAWLSGDSENAEQAARYCRAVYEAGFSPICPPLYLPLFLNDAVPEEHKSGIDMGRDLLRRSHVLVVCGHTMTEAMKNDMVCSKQLYKEALNHTFDEPKQWEIREINEIMNQCITGWRYFPNPRMFSEYGRQTILAISWNIAV